MSTKKLLPENIQIQVPAHLASATGLMGFSNTLPECPSRLPDGTILDYSAVDETWKDVDFPERELKPQTMQESRASLEASFFESFQGSKVSQATPAHILKHITRVQSLAALAPAKEEAVELDLQGAVQAANSILERNNLVIEADSEEAYFAGLQEVLETYELPEADYAELQEIAPIIGVLARKAAGAVAQKALGAVAQKATDKVRQVLAPKPNGDAEECVASFKKWRFQKEVTEASLEAPKAASKPFVKWQSAATA